MGENLLADTKSNSGGEDAADEAFFLSLNAALRQCDAWIWAAILSAEVTEALTHRPRVLSCRNIPEPLASGLRTDVG